MEKAALWEARHFLFHSLVDTFQGLEIRFTKVNTLPNVQQLVDVKYYSTAGSSNTNWISHLLYSSQTTTITGESYSCCFGRFSHSIPSTRLPPQFSSPSHTVPRGKKKNEAPYACCSLPPRDVPTRFLTQHGVPEAWKFALSRVFNEGDVQRNSECAAFIFRYGRSFYKRRRSFVEQTIRMLRLGHWCCSRHR